MWNESEDTYREHAFLRDYQKYSNDQREETWTRVQRKKRNASSLELVSFICSQFFSRRSFQTDCTTTRSPALSSNEWTIIEISSSPWNSLSSMVSLSFLSISATSFLLLRASVAARWPSQETQLLRYSENLLRPLDSFYRLFLFLCLFLIVRLRSLYFIKYRIGSCRTWLRFPQLPWRSCLKFDVRCFAFVLR